MVLVDSSIWVDHFRHGDGRLGKLLDAYLVLRHPFVFGEILMGNLRQRGPITRALLGLPAAVLAEDSEVIALVERYSLYGQGIGYIDAHLLASAKLTPDAFLWTRDKRLKSMAERLDVHMDLD